MLEDAHVVFTLYFLFMFKCALYAGPYIYHYFNE